MSQKEAILFFITKVRIPEKYGCPSNGSRKRRVYCTIDDALSGIRDSGLVGTCYDGEMAVGNDHSALNENTVNENRTAPIHGCSRTNKRLFKRRDWAGGWRASPNWPERFRLEPSAPELARTLPNRTERSRTGPSAFQLFRSLPRLTEKSAREKCTNIHTSGLSRPFYVNFLKAAPKLVLH